MSWCYVALRNVCLLESQERVGEAEAENTLRMACRNRPDKSPEP